MTSQHDYAHGMTLLYFLFLFLLGSTVAAIPLGRPPVGSMVYQHLRYVARYPAEVGMGTDARCGSNSESQVR